MKVIADNSTVISKSDRFVEVLLARINEGRVNNSGILFNEVGRGHVEYIGSNREYRLFFLLEGKMYLRGMGFGKYLLEGKEFMLLPSDCDINCVAIKKSKYVIITCSKLKSEGNLAYHKELRKQGVRQPIEYSSLPVKDKLEKVLMSFVVYTNNEYQYPAVYDTAFILLRTLYTSEEMKSLLLPLLHRELGRRE